MARYRVHGVIDFEIDIKDNDDVNFEIKKAIDEEVSSAIDWERIDEEE